MIILDMEVTFNIEKYHSLKQLLKLYKTESEARLARRIQAVYLAGKGHTCPEIMHITAVFPRVESC